MLPHRTNTRHPWPSTLQLCWTRYTTTAPRVAEAPQLLARWAVAFALARSRMTCVLDIADGDAPGDALDVYPARDADAPVLVFIHGGWWRALDKADHAFIAPSFTADGRSEERRVGKECW